MILTGVVCSLWGEHGQDAIELAQIGVLYATATGTETAKNLVLPGACGLISVLEKISDSDPRIRRCGHVDDHRSVHGDSCRSGQELFR
jgi:hypothetical protein